jgi:POT family proton-dependent oligopeptide transporter
MTATATADRPPEYPQLLGHPRPLWMLFMTEFWERFCYYGMRWALVLYIVSAFYAGDPSGQKPASTAYGAYTALVYATGILGGWAADKLLGAQRAVLLGGAITAIGLFTLFVKDHTIFLLGLSLIIVGNGLFKPNISTMVGSLYATGDSRRDRGFTIFYMGINAGAFFAPIVTTFLAHHLLGGTLDKPNYQVVFATAGVGMVLGLVWFLFGRGQLKGVGGPPAGKEGMGPVMLVTLGCAVLLVPAYLLMDNSNYLDYILWAMFAGCSAMLLRAGFAADRVQLDKIIALLILLVANILFWMFFEQAGSSFTFLSESLVDRRMFGGEFVQKVMDGKTTTVIDGFEFKIAWFQSVNPASIVIFATMVSAIWAWSAKRNAEPSIPRKFALGLMGNALGFAVLTWALGSLVFTTEFGAKLIPFWPLLLCYVLQTIGELAISPIGLSMVTKLAPASMVGATMGAWFMSISLGNKLGGNFAGWISGESGMTIESARDGFSLSFWLLLGAGVVLFLAAPRINKLMHGVK